MHTSTKQRQQKRPMAFETSHKSAHGTAPYKQLYRMSELQLGQITDGEKWSFIESRG
jgi:hypothetical protein